MLQVREKVNNLAIKTHNLGLSQLPILTVELPNYLTQELVAAVDVVGVNLQPFYTTKVNTSQSGWAAATVKGAIATYNQTAKKFPKKQLVVTEIGWPSRAGEADINRASEQLAGDFAKAWVQVRCDCKYLLTVLFWKIINSRSSCRQLINTWLARAGEPVNSCLVTQPKQLPMDGSKW
eukprot:GHRR01031340.1.p1 GENE.GHRR01031340.1~~GHRR01031340.1.p1  ORF type:complete len:178 (+),score=33.69 GHRR01031340.1:261-794(+)